MGVACHILRTTLDGGTQVATANSNSVHVGPAALAMFPCVAGTGEETLRVMRITSIASDCICVGPSYICMPLHEYFFLVALDLASAKSQPSDTCTVVSIQTKK